MKFPLFDRRAYYEDAQVRARLGEFFGGMLPASVSAVCFTSGTESHSLCRVQHPISELGEWLDQGAEINRSLWDRDCLLAHLDIEYVNFDFPLDVYLDPQRAFELQRPVRDTTLRVLRQYGIRPLHVLTGRGHHFIWSISQGSGPLPVWWPSVG